MSLRKKFFAAMYDRMSRKTEDAGLRDMRHGLLAGAGGSRPRDRRRHRREPRALQRTRRVARAHRAGAGDAPPPPGARRANRRRSPRSCGHRPRICPSRTTASTPSSRRSCSAASTTSRGRSARSAASSGPAGGCCSSSTCAPTTRALARFQDRMNWLNRFVVCATATARRSPRSRPRVHRLRARADELPKAPKFVAAADRRRRRRRVGQALLRHRSSRHAIRPGPVLR